MSKNVAAVIAAHGYCVGCGACAGICPNGALEMQWQKNGDRIVVETGGCNEKCSLCLQVCPFSNASLNEKIIAEDLFVKQSKIKYNSDTGFYHSCYGGHSKEREHRAKGASGGMVTWITEKLLKGDLVDAVVCVEKLEGENQDLFGYCIADNVESLQKAASTKYYPVEISKVLKTIKNNDTEKRYAIVGLPCTLKAVRNAMGHIPKLNRQIKYLLGLVCGHLPNRFYTDYLARVSGLGYVRLSSVQYRSKLGISKANEYCFIAGDAEKRQGKPLPFKNKVLRAWVHRFFQINSCNFCEDVFAETADAVFMDAWLPGFVKDPKGSSLVLVRSPELDDMLQQGVKMDSCHLDPVQISEIIKSQKGVIKDKKTDISGRLYYERKKRGKNSPNKKAASDSLIYLKNRDTIETNLALQEKTKKYWPVVRNKPLWVFHLILLPQLLQALVLNNKRRLKLVLKKLKL